MQTLDQQHDRDHRERQEKGSEEHDVGTLAQGFLPRHTGEDKGGGKPQGDLSKDEIMI